uniref:UPAR/Ly6 domain-containing protein n=1 Tax=Haemonchus contortus TaxID=6289 RepID=A0A6F7PXY1_HAECO
SPQPTAGMIFRLPIALLWLLPVCMAINCYRGAIYNSTAKPTEQITCQMINYCTKITAVLPVSLATYGCDQSAALCKINGCYDNQNGGLTCCCSTDLCNTSTNNLPVYLSAAFLILYLMF